MFFTIGRPDETPPESEPDAAISQTLSRLRIALVAMLALLTALGTAFPFLTRAMPDVGLSMVLFQLQDIYFLPLLMLALLVRPVVGSARTLGMMQGRAVLALGLLIILLCWLGTWAVFHDYALSRDEQMANFDAAIFSHGRAIWPIPIGWRSLADALNLIFIQPIGNHEAWVSAYLPVNAAMRALGDVLGARSLVSPILVGIGWFALWKVARSIWGDRGGPITVAMLLYLGSSQILVTGMTAYAMTGHLALDLLWLMLFRRGGAAGHGGAMLVGLLATGLHQPIFHPLFALPFLVLLGQRREWRLLAAYVAAYAVIGAIWAAWPIWITAHGSTPVPSGGAAHGIGYVSRLMLMLRAVDLGGGLSLMALNILRFLSWQHLLFLPLVGLGVATTWRADPFARALTWGLILPVAVILILLPYQGHSYGYRYLHGVLGNACLLGGYGWRWLEDRRLSLQKPMLIATGASLLIAAPAHAWMAYRFAKPFVDADREIAASHADLVLVDDNGAPFVHDLVLNRPDLSNRPLRLIGSAVPAGAIASLCRGRSLRFYDVDRMRAINHAFGVDAPPSANPHQLSIEDAARRAGCTIRAD